MRHRIALLVLLVAAATAGLLWSAGVGFRPTAQEVDAVRVRRGTLEVTLPAEGFFESPTVDLSFELPGRVRRVLVREGQPVEADDLLALLEDAELRAAAEQATAAARSALYEAERAREAVRAAEAELHRAMAAGRAARRELERAEGAVAVARAQLRQALAAYRAARANLAQLRAGPRPEELRQVESAVEAAEVGLEEARRHLEVQERLHREGAVAEVQVEAARTQYETARARLRQVQAQRDLLRAGPRREAIVAAEEQVAQAEAALEAARAVLRQAEAARRAAVENVAQAKAAERVGRANVAQARSALGAARSRAEQALAAAQAARARLEKSRLRAPFAGTVVRVLLNPGAAVSPGVPVLRLAAREGWVTAEVDEAEIGQIHLGQSVRIRADAYPGRFYRGRVTWIAPSVETRLQDRIVRVRVALASPVRMRVGTAVDVEFVVDRIPRVLLVPAEAVVEAADGSAHVYVVEGGVLRRRPVVRGRRNEVQVAVLQGLREGELVALADPQLLRDGLRVRIRGIP
ncbi:MAG: efflux RND transporter periplasmic adaptor subunit [Armatimonadota bacterium]|nr:efflux RND transporter periplasmic adaptor subunit [Armatimonadota bacterium]MDR7444483.1 efflux RND transporter periplasmic adaptor subunit [Armatimonadota bacterium]MDR7570815.1 efflux RND transporter periplasmic adaptor subunit [Armatimonadota bacterium]MDR7615212.1 efflux RND transporter periplasmic adaptor subunit [Armatimonadota bacterium]